MRPKCLEGWARGITEPLPHRTQRTRQAIRNLQCQWGVGSGVTTPSGERRRLSEYGLDGRGCLDELGGVQNPANADDAVLGKGLGQLAIVGLIDHVVAQMLGSEDVVAWVRLFGHLGSLGGYRPQAAGLVVLEGLHELGPGVHHERAVSSDRLPDRLAA